MTTQSSKDQFDRNAEKYATSHVHRSGPSLPVLLELARPEEADQALDIATGTGHTAIAVAHHVRKAIGIDVAPKMLEQARRLAADQQRTNCEFIEGSAEELPLADGLFTLVTSRHAPHHFRNVGLFLQEVRRVLAPGGRFVMSDQITPSRDLCDWVDHWERTRDPSHFLQRTVDQWREEIAKARMQWVEHRIVPYRLEFDWWVRTAGCSDSAIAALVEHAASASTPVREALGLEFDSKDRVTAFQEPMLVMRACFKGDELKQTV
jgi:ubiquinone/menaquinone biosynthesis C-methylase UbiE